MFTTNDKIMGTLVRICNDHVFSNARKLIKALLAKEGMLKNLCFISENVIDFESNSRK